MMDQSIRRYFRRMWSTVCSLVRNRTIQRAEMAWEITVARAAPWGPISSRKMKMGSRIILASAPMITEFMLARVKPWALMKALSPRASCTKGVPQV